MKYFISRGSPDSLSLVAGMPAGHAGFLEDLDKAVVQYLETCGSEEKR